MESWIDQELAGCQFADERLGKRKGFGMLMEQLSQGIGRPDPAGVRRLLGRHQGGLPLPGQRPGQRSGDSGRALCGHALLLRRRGRAGTRAPRHKNSSSPSPAENAQAIGLTHKVAKGHKDKAAAVRMHTVCGILMHSSLALTTDGVPLGLTAIKLWTRKKFKGTNALKGRGTGGGKHSVNTTRIPIEQKESIRWLENVRQATETLGDPSSHASTSATAKATSTNCSARIANRSSHTSSSAPAWIAAAGGGR